MDESQRPTLLLRRDAVFELAAYFRNLYDGLTIEEIAEHSNIVVRREYGPAGGPDGIALIERTRMRLAVGSVVDPERVLPVWGGQAEVVMRVVLINRHSQLSESEIWWHEFYHILFSPPTSGRTVIAFDGSRHQNRVEERRADDFAAAMLVPSLSGCRSLDDVQHRFNISKRLARHALELHVALSKR